MVDRLNGQKIEKNGLNSLNGTEINSIKRVNNCLNGCLGEHEVNLVYFCMDKFVYLSLLCL